MLALDRFLPEKLEIAKLFWQTNSSIISGWYIFVLNGWFLLFNKELKYNKLEG